MSHDSQLKNPKYRCWVKAGLGLKYLKEGLEHFTMEIMDEQHQAILMTVRKSSRSPTCEHCHINTLQPSHVRTKTHHCPLGAFDCNCRQPKGKRPCPVDVCSFIYDQIINLHGSTPPAPYWRNTKVGLWCTSPWEVAKCFINAPGYAHTTSAKETDCAGLLHVIVNNKAFHSHLHCDINGSDIFCKTRQYRNEILHSATMELEDQIADMYIEDMIDVLRDPKELASRSECIAAVEKLLELKQKNFVITSQNEMEVLKEMREELERTKIKGLEEMKTAVRDHIENIEEKARGVRTAIQDAKSKAVEDIRTTHKSLFGKDESNTIKDDKDKLQNKYANSQEKDVNKKGVESNNSPSEIKVGCDVNFANIKLRKKRESELADNVEEITDTVSKQQISNVPTSEESKEHHDNDIEWTCEETVDVSLQNEEAAICTSLQEETAELCETFDSRTKSVKHKPDYEAKKQAFRNRLVDLYMDTVVKVSALPLNPEVNAATINELYVTPWLTFDGNKTILLKNRNKSPEEKLQNGGGRNIASYEDIFYKDGKIMKLIYIVGDAGSGKSAFCKNMIYEWCTVHSDERNMTVHSEKWNTMTEDTKTEHMSDKDILKRFDFLFYISLRHNVDSSDIRTMLLKQYEDPVLDMILEKESAHCLVLLDGLDEWKPPVEQKHSQFQTVGLPERELSKQYTVVTTSRPWKVEVLKIKESEIDNKIKLRGIEFRSIIKLATFVVSHLNKMFDENKSANRFLAKYVLNTEHKKSPLDDFIKSPIMLQQLLCLWFDCKLKQFSRFYIYCSMLELSLEWSIQRNPEDKTFEVFREKSMAMENINLPFSLEEYPVIEEYKYVIFNAGKIAYYTLFSEQKELSLTFDRGTLRKLGASTDLIQCCLNMGILTEEQNITFSLSKRHNTQFSFTHKSIQEVLAAIYIVIKCQSDHSNASKMGEPKEVVKMHLRNIKTVEDVLEQSNVIELICGLSPSLASELTKYIYDILTRDERFLHFRTTFTDWRIYRIVSEIQELIFGCIKEFDSSEKDENPELYLSDIIIRDKADIAFLKNIQVSTILSVTIAGEIWGLSRSSIHLSDTDVDKLCNIVDQRSVSLQRFSKIDPVTTDPLEEVPLYCALIVSPNRQLKTLELKDIKLPHETMLDLSLFLKNNEGLQMISFTGIHCDLKQCTLHETDLSGLYKLIFLHIEKCSLSITGLNVQNLKRCQLAGQKSLSMFNFLECAPVLEYLHLSSLNFNGSHKFISNVPSLRCIDVCDVGFSKAAWLSFIQCLKCCHSLRELIFDCLSIPEEIRPTFISDIQAIQKLEHLDLKNMTISSILPQGFKYLRQLRIQNVTCFTADLCDFIDSTEYLDSLENLVIKNIDFRTSLFHVSERLAKLAHIALNNVKLTKEAWLGFARNLKFLAKLESVELQSVTLPDRAFSFAGMNHVRSVRLVSVMMNLPTWIEIVDSLSSLPQNVDVQTIDLYIQNGTTSDAVDYVKAQKELFQVTVKFGVDCSFKTKRN